MSRAILVTILASLCLTAGITACRGGDRKTPVKRSLNRNDGGDGVRSGTAQAILKASGNKGCFRLSALKKLADEKNIYTIYTSDIDVGLLSPGAGTVKGGHGCMPVFQSKTDETPRALAVLQYHQPVRELSNPADLFTTSVLGASLLGVNPSEQECSSASFLKDGNYQVICKGGPGSVALRNADGKIRVYRLENSQLTITVYTPQEIATCRGTLREPNLTLKETFVLAWGEGLRETRVSRSLAELLSKHLNFVPQELSDRLTTAPATSKPKTPRPVSGSINLSYGVYDELLREILQGRVKNVCSGS